ncbi:hypothetical protein Tco_0305024 [Tanacetum coccineum]
MQIPHLPQNSNRLLPNLKSSSFVTLVVAPAMAIKKPKLPPMIYQMANSNVFSIVIGKDIASSLFADSDIHNGITNIVPTKGRKLLCDIRQQLQLNKRNSLFTLVGKQNPFAQGQSLINNHGKHYTRHIYSERLFVYKVVATTFNGCISAIIRSRYDGPEVDEARLIRVPVPLPDDPYVAVRQAQLVDNESDPEEAPSKAEELQILGSRVPLIGEEFEAFEPSGTRTTSSHSLASSDSTALLSPDHPLTHVSPTPTPTRASFHRRTTRMIVRAQPAMSPV